jgi:hydrogenase maturation protease
MSPEAMKRTLILGLGNTLMGDDGAGMRVAELLLADPFVTIRADVIAAGTDVLRVADRFAGRRLVILVDAAICDHEPGWISVADECLCEEHKEHAHSLSAPHTVELLQTVMPFLAHASFKWVLIGVSSVGVGQEMSARVAAAVPHAAAMIKRLLRSRESIPVYTSPPHSAKLSNNLARQKKSWVDSGSGNLPSE